jgi:putative endonuclease
MPVVLYVLKSAEKPRRYVGITRNLDQRLRSHRKKESKGGQLLGRFVVIHTEEFPDYVSARKREIFLKSGQGRKWMDEFLSKVEPAKGG